MVSEGPEEEYSVDEASPNEEHPILLGVFVTIDASEPWITATSIGVHGASAKAPKQIESPNRRKDP
jgi:hypothetical protein